MAGGPDGLLGAGLARRLEGSRVERAVDVVRLVPDGGWRAELRTTFQLHHRVAGEVRAAIAGGRAPFVIAGDCNMTVAVAAGLGPGGRTGVVWLDAHGDLNTPETDASGYLDGQGLAMLTGRCWTAHTPLRWMRAVHGD
jgi:arginase